MFKSHHTLGLAMLAVSALTVAVLAAEPCCEDHNAVTVAQNQKLPEGHPPLDPKLPQGHPPLDSKLPQGHPPVDSNLPQGHPPVGGAAADRNQVVTGTLVIKATQGTAEGTAIGETAVKVELYSHAGPPQTIEGQLDPHGVLMIEDFKFQGVVQPVVSVQHAGVSYQAIGRTMNATQPDQIIKVTVYDTTDEAPAWSLRNRHVYMQIVNQTLQVQEVIIVENPGDRAWLGAPQSDAENAPRATIKLTLPAGAQNARVMRAPENTQIVGDQLVQRSSLVPGQTEMRIAYELPVEDHAVSFVVAAPAPTRHLMVFLPEDNGRIEAEGLTAGEPLNSRGRAIRALTGSDIPPDRAVKVEIASNVRTSAAPAPTPAGEPQPKPFPMVKVVAATGGLLIVVAGASLLLVRKPAAQRDDAD